MPSLSVPLKKNFSQPFPTPEYLSLSSAGIAVSDNDIKFIEFRRSIFKEGLKPVRAERILLDEGVIQSGFVNDAEKFKASLKQLADKTHARYVHVAVPEERAYLFTTVIDAVPEDGLRDAVAFILEENVPLSLEKAAFDVDVLGEVEPGKIKVAVAVLSLRVVEFYTELFEAVGLTPVSFDIQSQAIARALVPVGDRAPQLIVNLEKEKTGLYVIEDGVVQFSTSFAYGIHDTLSPNLFPFKKEILKTVTFWANRSEERAIETVLVCGEGSDRAAIINELAKEHSLSFISCNPWNNPAFYSVDPPQHILENSLDYSAVIGASLANLRGHINKLLDVSGGAKVKKEYARRRLIVGLWSFAFVLVVALVGTMPAFTLASTRNQEMQERLHIMSLESPDVEDESLLTWLSQTKVKLAALSPQLDQSHPSFIIETFLAEKPGGVYVTTMTWDARSANESETLVVSGLAVDRQALLSLESGLNASGKFSEIDLPLSTLAKERDISFQIKLVPKTNP